MHNLGLVNNFAMTYLCSVLSVILMTLYNNFTEQLHKEITKKNIRFTQLFPVCYFTETEEGLRIWRGWQCWHNRKSFDLMKQTLLLKMPKYGGPSPPAPLPTPTALL